MRRRRRMESQDFWKSAHLGARGGRERLNYAHLFYLRIIWCALVELRRHAAAAVEGLELPPASAHLGNIGRLRSREQYVVVCARSLAFQSRSAWHAPSISRKLPRKWPNLTGWWLSIPRPSWISFATSLSS